MRKSIDVKAATFRSIYLNLKHVAEVFRLFRFMENGYEMIFRFKGRKIFVLLSSRSKKLDQTQFEKRCVYNLFKQSM